MQMRRLLTRRSFEPTKRCCSQSACTGTLSRRQNRRTTGGWVSRKGKRSSAGNAHRKRPGSISCRSPAGASIQAHTLIRHYLEHATASKGLRVCLTFDFEDVQGQKDDLPNANDTTGLQCGLSTCTTGSARTCLRLPTSWPSLYLSQKFGRTCRHDEAQDSLGQKVDHRIYRSFAGLCILQRSPDLGIARSTFG